jgi:hypothetical protein
LAVLILAFLPSLLYLVVWLVILALAGVVVVIAIAYPEFGAFLGFGLALLIFLINEDRLKGFYGGFPPAIKGFIQWIIPLASAPTSSQKNSAKILPELTAINTQSKTNSKYGIFFMCLVLGLLVALLFGLVVEFIAFTMIVEKSRRLITFTATFIIVLPLSTWLFYRTWPR